MSFPSYPKYVDFGVYGIDRLPLGWRLLPVKYVGKLKGGAGFPHSKQGVTGGALSFYKVNALSRADSDGCLSIADDTVSEETAAELGAFIFPPGAIVFAKVGAALLLGRIRTIAARACLDNNMMGLVAKFGVSDSAFLRYAVGLVRFDLLANPGAVPSINETQVGDFRLPMPPLSEQLQIASFLDQETSKIDALISEQQRLIELLKEKRQAVISHAVTKGLSPDVRMKPSGVEWLGEVPEHWDISRLGFWCSKIGSGKTPLGGAETYQDEGVLFIRSQNVYDEGLLLDDVVYISCEEDEGMPTSRVLAGDILLNITGASLGRTCIVPEPFPSANVNQHVCIIRVREKELAKYLGVVLKSAVAKEQFNFVQNGAAREGLNYAQISKTAIAVPPVEEQAEIFCYLEHTLANLDALVAAAGHSIGLLQERRTALISAAVTGKIDVRNYAATQKDAA